MEENLDKRNTANGRIGAGNVRNACAVGRRDACRQDSFTIGVGDRASLGSAVRWRLHDGAPQRQRRGERVELIAATAFWVSAALEAVPPQLVTNQVRP